jgi:hypothetical protein
MLFARGIIQRAGEHKLLNLFIVKIPLTEAGFARANSQECEREKQEAGGRN